MTETNRLFFITPHWRLVLLSLLAILTGCSTTPPVQTTATDHAQLPKPINEVFYHDEIQAMLLLYQQHEAWRGTPYRIGGVSRSGIDCSAFVQITFRELFSVDLPRTTEQQMRIGNRINRKQLQPGDLVFFRNGSHVGIYVENNKFLHASTSRGVMISNMDNTYWSRHFSQAVSVRR